MNQNPAIKQIILPVGMLVIAAVLAVGFVYGLRVLTGPSPTPVTTPSTSPIEGKYIELGQNLQVEKKDSYTQVNSPDVFVEYFYQINPTTEITFREAGQETWDKGDVILEKDGVEKVLKQNTELSSPSFFAYNVLSTNKENIYVLASGIVDVLAYLVIHDYIDVAEERIVLSVKNVQMEAITVMKANKNFELQLETDDDCGEDLEREGKSAYVIDVLLNGERTNSIVEPIETSCVSGRNGYFYNPNVIFDETKVSSDFSEVSFALKGIHVSQNASQEVWQRQFILNLENGSINNI